MYKIDFHADDFGITPYNSKRILELIKCGKLDSFSIIPNMSGYDDSMKLLKEEWNNLPIKPRIAIHINLLGGYSISTSKPNPTDLTWGKIFIKTLSPGKKRANFLDYIYSEISAQIERVVSDLKDISPEAAHKISLDSHVHIHMIPAIFRVFIRVVRSIKSDTNIEYIRISNEPITPFIKSGVIKTCSLTGIIKNTILKLLSVHSIFLLKKNHIPYGVLCGLLMSGHMDPDRIEKLLPAMADYSRKKNLPVEIMLHPGIVIERDHLNEYIKDDVEAFYSENRNVEYNTVTNRDRYTY